MNACRKNDNPMPGDLSDLRPFERILATGSLSAAAREACLLRTGAPLGFGRRPLLPPIATSRNQSPDLRVHLELEERTGREEIAGRPPACRAPYRPARPCRSTAAWPERHTKHIELTLKDFCLYIRCAGAVSSIRPIPVYKLQVRALTLADEDRSPIEGAGQSAREATALIRRARRVHYARVELMHMPSMTRSTVREFDGNSYVVLRTISGELIDVYRVLPAHGHCRGQLEKLHHFPREVAER